MAIIQARDLTKQYAGNLKALDAVSFSVDSGEWVSIMGPSGSGKTTLLNLLAGLDQPTSGSLEINGRDLASFNERELTEFRSSNVGLVFQQFHLIPYLTAVENLMVAQYYHSMADEKEAAEALRRVGLGERLTHLPSQLSGGEQQRVCIARALINKPPVILADEPTGNLDEQNEEIVLGLLQDLHEEGHTLVVVTHDHSVGKLGNRRLQLEHGRVAGTHLTPEEREEDIDEWLEKIWLTREAGPIAAVPGMCKQPRHETLEALQKQQLIRPGIRDLVFTDTGEARARNLIRRHRLAEKLFSETLGMDEQLMEAEACRFEHILSAEVTDSMCSFFGHPRTCPHGKPIPPGQCCSIS